MIYTIRRGLRIGYDSLRVNLVSALILQAIIFLIAWAYYCVPASRSLFDTVGDWKSQARWWHSFLLSGLMVGALSEVFRVYCTDRGRWSRGHVEDMIFKFFLMGFIYAMTDRFYLLQELLFGRTDSNFVLIKKILFEFFVFSFFVTVPIQTFLFRWKEKGFKFGATVKSLKSFNYFFTEKHLPMWVGIVCFWGPINVVIYSMPPALQFPICLTAGIIWGILIVNISRSS